MASIALRLLLAGSLSIGAATAARSAETFPVERSVCFERSYDAEHLRAHPRQRLTHLRLDLRMRKSHPDRAAGASAAREGFDDLDLNLDLAVRAPTQSFSSLGACRREPAGLACKLECDVGSFDLTVTPAGDLRVAFKQVSINGCGADDNLAAPAGDDQTALLKRMPDTACMRHLGGAD